MTTLYDFECKLNNGEMKSLGDYKNEVLLIVNTASGCGFTNQYEGLERLHKSYQEQGLKILAFPCNQFGLQENSSEEEILPSLEYVRPGMAREDS